MCTHCSTAIVHFRKAGNSLVPGMFLMTVGASVTLNLGVIKITLTQDELASLRKRFNRSPLYKGPVYDFEPLYWPRA